MRAALKEWAVWTESYIRLRHWYRPDLPLGVLFLEPFAQAAPATLPNDRRYRGCRWWVELNAEVELQPRRNILSPGELRSRADELIVRWCSPQLG